MLFYGKYLTVFCVCVIMNKIILYYYVLFPPFWENDIIRQHLILRIKDNVVAKNRNQ